MMIVIYNKSISTVNKTVTKNNSFLIYCSTVVFDAFATKGVILFLSSIIDG